MFQKIEEFKKQNNKKQEFSKKLKDYKKKIIKNRNSLKITKIKTKTSREEIL